MPSQKPQLKLDNSNKQQATAGYDIQSDVDCKAPPGMERIHTHISSDAEEV